MARTITPSAVLAEVERVMSRPFAWGPCDCTSAACDVFAALWGIDPLAPWRSAYSSPLAAARRIRALGGPLAAAEEMARRAGLVLGEAPGSVGLAGRSLVICISPGHWAGKTPSGFGIVRAVERAWHA